MSIEELDQSKVEQFTERVMSILNSGAIALMTSIGHRSGLFDALSLLPPSTSEKVAEAAGLNERYVREWLGAMVTARIVDFNPEDKTYYLPREHAALLTRAASPNNLAATAQFLPLLASVEDRVLECFQNGGGVPYSDFPRFHEVMAEESNMTVVAGLFEHILPLVPGVVEELESGITVLDVGCGRGHAVTALAEAFPKSSFIGFDFSEEAIRAANEEARRRGLSNVRFEVKDVATMNGSKRFDLITAFDAIHDQAQPAKVLKAIASALEKGGTFLMQDITGSSHVHKNLEHPLASYMYTVSCMHCMTVSLALGGAGLGTMWGEETARQMLEEAGFTSVEVKRLPHDIMNNYYIAITE